MMIRIKSLANRDTALRPSARPVIAAHSLSPSAEHRYDPCLSTKDRGGKKWRCTTAKSMSHSHSMLFDFILSIDFSHSASREFSTDPSRYHFRNPSLLLTRRLDHARPSSGCSGLYSTAQLGEWCCYLQFCDFRRQRCCSGRRCIQAVRESHKHGWVQ
ncbi:hypothetical protein M440DRAFT_85850 [Trichoderma longibrachiatum ATCC 18648]|uniref:Uncharacterized protein n=1 Tax=Trichoderma longibrachiatum ATCC 18648 TaxID=983965 RepID=A0A2T4CIW3_TRILO|nr:hypothetical protein M440DRAFT_85850 [Trichoderma longibrachiatum ATCC 18648]